MLFAITFTNQVWTKSVVDAKIDEVSLTSAHSSVIFQRLSLSADGGLAECAHRYVKGTSKRVCNRRPKSMWTHAPRWRGQLTKIFARISGKDIRQMTAIKLLDDIVRACLPTSEYALGRIFWNKGHACSRRGLALTPTDKLTAQVLTLPGLVNKSINKKKLDKGPRQDKT